MSELYNRSIEVFVPPKGITPINIFHEEYYKNNDADPPIRLCYMDGNHYNAIIDPLVPTAGLGLGLPGLQPGLADKLQMEQAKHASNESALDEKMQLALKESNRAQKEREEREMKEVLTKSALSMDDAYQKKALYLSEIEAADFDLEQAVRQVLGYRVVLCVHNLMSALLYIVLIPLLPFPIHFILSPGIGKFHGIL